MSNEDEVTLAHDDFIIENGIAINEMPQELQDIISTFNGKLDAYEADPNDEVFETLLGESADLKLKIEDWFKTKSAPPAEAKKEETPPAAKKEETPPAAKKEEAPPAAAAEEDSPNGGWGINTNW